MMNITLQPEQERFIQEQLASGRFKSVDDFLSHTKSSNECNKSWRTALTPALSQGLPCTHKSDSIQIPTEEDRLKPAPALD
jgi:Arc/MetJ-type ribon-helix-helix transcriptional regulator